MPPPRPYTCSTPLRAPELHASTPPRLHACSVLPKPQGSTPPRLHDCSPSPYLLEATHLQRTSRAPGLHTSTPPRPQARSMPPDLHPSMPSRRSAFRDTLSVRWPRKPSLRASRATRANPIKPHQNFTLTRLQYASRARLASSRTPYLHVCTPAAHLQSSRTPYLHVCTPAAHLQSS